MVVGGQGSVGSGGFNGGGYPLNAYMGGGGGGSDVRIGGLTNPCAKQSACDWIDRIVGGGGDANGNGGAGGGPHGASASGRGGGQEDHFIHECGIHEFDGMPGCGGNPNTSAEGAGGGWYGGYPAYPDGGGGGGGSGYVSSLALSTDFPGGTHLGDGRVVISSP